LFVKVNNSGGKLELTENTIEARKEKEPEALNSGETVKEKE